MQVLDDYSVRDMVYHPAIHTNVRDFLSMEVKSRYRDIYLVGWTAKYPAWRVTLWQVKTINS